jgi:gluconate 2-dehydrogenase gamma chain
MDDNKPSAPRRALLIQAAGLVGAGYLAPVAVQAATAVTAPANAPGPAAPPPAPLPYQSLSPGEAAFVEALVNAMCPPDDYTPGGVDCGLATYIDRQLAGSFGQGAGRYQRGPFRSGKPELGLQLPLTPEQFFKAGLAAAQAACSRDRGRHFDQLEPAVASEFLAQIQAGKVSDPGIALATWFNELVYPLFVEACFADPMYGGNRNAVFWKMVGYPGLPATHTLNIVKFRGKPFPGSATPKSIADFS